MTPASPILHYMAAHEKSKSLVVKQTEDEIAAIHAAIGASFAGVRSMVATSGGGFCLMTEALGLAALTETPLVLVEAQRPGPSTGLATRTGQGDLRFVMHASQGEFPRIIITPGDVEESFYLTLQAFNLAEKYQVPAIILIDKHLAESNKTTEFFNQEHALKREVIDVEAEDYKRFKMTETGVSPRAIPGQKAIFRTPSYEHDEYGWNNEDPENRTRIVDKRNRKEKYILDEIAEPKSYGDENSEITLIGWGSTKGAILEAMQLLEKEGIKTNFIHYNFILPFKSETTKNLLKKAKKTMIVEQNSTAQLAGLIKEKTGLDVDYKLLNYTGRQILPHQIIDKIKEVLKD
jgi:2-oxoglutarate ferredoxin oxidoreductase subunit alpha